MILSHIFNEPVITSIFPDELKLGDITPTFKEEDPYNIKNHRPISLLPVSKVFERILSKQISVYIEQYLSKYLCGFRKGHSPQHCLVVMIEEIKMCLDNKGIAGAIFTDLSKAFDCLTYDLLIAKLNSCGFSYFALKLILNYLTNRKQRTRIDATTSKWEKVQIGVPQGSITPPPPAV